MRVAHLVRPADRRAVPPRVMVDRRADPGQMRRRHHPPRMGLRGDALVQAFDSTVAAF